MTDENKIKNYPIIIEKWVRTFIDTMDIEDYLNGDLKAGNNSGTVPFGVKIIFDGYGTDKDENEEKNNLSFAIFVHKDSLTKEFKEHETNPLALIHRPKEECYINCWYSVTDEEIENMTMVEDESDSCTELDRNFVIDLIHKIDERDKK